MADTRLTPRPQQQGGPRAVQLDVAARPVDMGAGHRPSTSEVDGLVQGLTAFNPALQRFAAIKDAELTHQATQHGKAEAQRRGLDDVDLRNEEPPQAGFSPTYQSIYRDAYRAGIVERTAEKANQDLIAKYHDEKDRPDFSVDAFISQNRGEHLNGLDDDMAAHMGKSLSRLEGAVRQDYERIRLARLDETRESSISATLRNVITADEPEAIAAQYRTEVLPVIMGLGKTRKEGAQYLLRHLGSLSDSVGGRPEIFDTLLTQKDEAGMTIGDSNPAMHEAIVAAKQRATVQRDKILHDAAQEGNAHVLKDLDERVAKDPWSVNFDDLTKNLGKNSVFTTDNEVITYWRSVLKARGDQSGQVNLLRLAKIGQLYMADEKDQKAIMGALTGTAVANLSAVIESGDTSNVASITDALVSAHRVAGSNVASPQIERMFKFIGQGNGAGEKPSAIFSAAAEVYRRLENSPQLRDAYFDENSRKVMQAYVQAIEGQAEPNAAFKAAYETVSPEAKRREEAFKQTPEYKEKLSKVTKWVTGSSFVPRFIGGNGRPDNAGQLMGEAQEYALNLMKRNPNMTEAEAIANTESWAARSFVLDSTTGTAIKVPTGVSPEAAQKAVTAYTAKLTKELGLDQRESGWRVLMLPVNINQGTYRVMTSFNGAPVHPVGDASMKDIVEGHRRDTLWLPEDAKVLKDAQLAITAGKPVSSQGLAEVTAKARQLGVQPELVRQIDAYELKSATDALTMRPRTEVPFDTNALFKTDRRMKLDHKGTSESAQRLLNTAQGGSTGLAASLITMGEHRMLRAYDDPAKGAGRNIGMGYNLNANKATAEKDLRAAGVPLERIAGIIDGTMDLSPEQAERLVMVSVGRYESQAASQVNSLQPRLWERLQPQQRAVLTDIAYQTGNVGQFKKALSSLVSGDIEGFRNESKVFYTNKAGEKVEDKRRNALRDAMLSGTSYWQAVISRNGAHDPTVALNLK